MVVKTEPGSLSRGARLGVATGAILALAVSVAAAAPRGDPVQAVNRKVAEIDAAIRGGELPGIVVREEVPSEGAPPSYTLYTRGPGGKLAAAIITVGHETWGNTFAYYFDEEQRILKYSKTCQGRPDCEPRSAILYDAAGKVLWKNTDEPYAPPARIVALFRTIVELREELGRY